MYGIPSARVWSLLVASTCLLRSSAATDPFSREKQAALAWEHGVANVNDASGDWDELWLGSGPIPAGALRDDYALAFGGGVLCANSSSLPGPLATACRELASGLSDALGLDVPLLFAYSEVTNTSNGLGVIRVGIDRASSNDDGGADDNDDDYDDVAERGVRLHLSPLGDEAWAIAPVVNAAVASPGDRRSIGGSSSGGGGGGGSGGSTSGGSSSGSTSGGGVSSGAAVSACGVSGAPSCLALASPTGRGALFGVFSLLRLVRRGQVPAHQPHSPPALHLKMCSTMCSTTCSTSWQLASVSKSLVGVYHVPIVRVSSPESPSSCDTRPISLLSCKVPASPASALALSDAPKAALRSWQLWDNLDGTIERGYGGRSLLHWEELPGIVRPR